MIQELNVNNFDQEINKDKPVVVEFYTPHAATVRSWRVH